jgi:hypothetical protein
MARAAVAPAIGAPQVQIIAPAPLGATALEALRAREIDARLGEASDTDGDVIAWALSATPTAAAAIELAKTCARAAALGRPVCILAPFPEAARKASRVQIERVAALAYLRAHGAAIGHDVDAWLESIVLLVRYGAPRGPHAAVIAPSGSWLEAQSLSIAAEMEAANVRPPVIGPRTEAETTDVVLYDPALGAPPSTMPGLHVPVAPRAELATDPAMLYGARAALAAVTILGRASERIAVGLGPAPRTASAELGIDHERLQRQLDKLVSNIGRVGDHETKVLLAAYGIPITRQAVATTPSAAVKIARKAGYPVEIKPWGHDQPTEPAGCPVEKNVGSDAFVRHAFTTILASANRADREGAVIVRETPPAGRELSVTLLELPSLGWTVVLDAPGAGQLAAPAPLRLLDAQQLAAQIISSRAGDAEPDRVGLANLLRRASHLVVDLAGRIARVELPRVIVGGRGARTLVVDAALELE